MLFRSMSAEYSRQAVKVISRMDKITKQRIRQGILDIPKGDIKPLKGSEGSYRLRLGNWRIIFSYIDKSKILVEKIAPRGQAYKEG